MSDPAVFDAIARTLADAHARFGATAFTNRRRLTGLLADRVADARREIRAVGTGVDEGVPAALGGCERHLVGMEMDRLAERLDASTGLRLDIARPVVRGFAYALGLGPLPSIYIASVPTHPPTAPPAPTADEAVRPHPTLTHSSAASPVSVPVAPSRPISAYPQRSDEDEDVFVFAGRSVPRKQAYLAAGGLLLVLASIRLLGDRQPETPAATGPVVTRTVVTTPTTGINGTDTGNVGEAQRTVGLGAPVPEQNYADESSENGVPSTSELSDTFGATPLLVPGARRITTAALQRKLAGDPTVVTIDVSGLPRPRTLPGALYAPDLGRAGTVDDATQLKAAAALDQLTDRRKLRPVVFLCQHTSCWQSYNAVRRAATAGYINLYWYRGGITAWETAGLPTVPTPSPIG